jgi:hypothetical protein
MNWNDRLDFAHHRILNNSTGQYFKHGGLILYILYLARLTKVA